jgi:hypothetical protein
MVTATFATLGMVLTLGCGDTEITQPQPNPISYKRSQPQPQADDGIPETVFGRVSGGGQIRNDGWKVSFAGQLRGLATHTPNERPSDRWDGSSPKGQWVVQFHNVSFPEISGGTFKSTSIESVVFFRPSVPVPNCVAATTVTALGRFNGEPGWTMALRAADVGQEASSEELDRVRITLSYPGGPDYDTEFSGDFPLEGGCIGPHKTRVDAGNVKVRIQDR